MSKSGNGGLCWHKQLGWYKRYPTGERTAKGLPTYRAVYFGGRETPKEAKLPAKQRHVAEQTRRAESEENAYRRWHEQEMKRLGEEVFQPAAAPSVRHVGAVFDMLQQRGAAELAVQGAKTADEVEAIRRLLADGLRAAQPEPPAASKSHAPGAPTAKTVADIYIAYCRRERKPRHAYDVEKRLKPWLKHVGESTPIAALTREHFKSYRAHLLDQVKVREKWEADQRGPISPRQKQHAPGLSAALFNNLLAVVKGAFTAAEREDGITALHLPSYVKVLKSKKTKQTDRPIFSPDDIERLLASFDGKWKAMALLSLNTAATNVDLSEISWQAINFEKGILDYRRAKNGNIRRLPLWKRTIQALVAHQPDVEKRKGAIFLSGRGASFITYSRKLDGAGRPKLTPNDNLAKQFRLRRDALGLSEHFTWGTFRKSAATIANRENDRDTVQMLLGDASDEVWKRYAMIEADGKLRKATLEIERFYFPPKRKDARSDGQPSPKKRCPKA